jgi:hypothetical protein
MSLLICIPIFLNEMSEGNIKNLGIIILPGILQHFTKFLGTIKIVKRIKGFSLCFGGHCLHIHNIYVKDNQP